MRILRRPLTIYYLQRYFASGWAFLIPYLAAYLLYYVTDWPVNPVTDAPLSPLTPPTPLTSPAPVPSLLHLYWVLHALHLALASYALWTWWRAKSAPRPIRAPLTPPSTVPVLQPQLPNFNWRNDALVRIAPWFLLALIFYIPGVYLEWPSDPWEHLRRINEWRNLDTVGAHSSWYKSSYFIPYSLLSWCIGLRQLFWLDFYYTGICLLLCWQYYKFARACGLGERASMVFVIIQALLFGNNIFSFYRYYGISSSIYAQLGAVALTRIVLEWAAWGTSLHRKAPSTPSPSPHTLSSAPSASYFTLHFSPFTLPSRPSFWHLPTSIILAPIALSLLSLTAFNHIQGIGIAGIGVTAIIVWRLIEYKRSALWWLIGGTIAINALFLWLYPRPEIIEIYRAQGWLNAWYGFGYVNLNSAAGDRMLQILGLGGLLSCAAAILMFPHNKVAGWLAITPIALLQLPCITTPLAEAVYRAGGESYIITFQRMFFAAPSVLAALLFIQERVFPKGSRMNDINGYLFLRQSKPKSPNITWAMTFAFTTAIVVVPSSAPSYSRVWHILVRIPADLKLEGLFKRYEKTSYANTKGKSANIISTQTGSALLTYGTTSLEPNIYRTVGVPSSISSRASINAFGIDLAKAVRDGVGRGLYRSSERNSSLHHFAIWKARFEADSWEVVMNDPPVFCTSEGGTQIMKNNPGKSTWVLSTDAIAVHQLRTYTARATVRASGRKAPKTYLALAWYNENLNLIDSYAPIPLGAGNPQGWINGTYSYFGLINEAPPSDWTQYSITFGVYCRAVIPGEARYVRLGVLIDVESSTDDSVQISEFALTERAPEEKPLIVEPKLTYTPYSLASLLSLHWPQNQVSVDRGGTDELIQIEQVVSNQPVSTSALNANQCD